MQILRRAIKVVYTNLQSIRWKARFNLPNKVMSISVENTTLLTIGRYLLISNGQFMTITSLCSQFGYGYSYVFVYKFVAGRKRQDGSIVSFDGLEKNQF